MEIRTICRMCHGGCGALVQVEQDQVMAIRGDPENPNNHGFLCSKGRASLELLADPQRLQTPLRRVGPRGSNRFTPMGWDEALDLIAERLGSLRDSAGAESVVFAQGTDRNYQEWLFRFANAFGSPNVLGPAHVCFYPRMMAGRTTFGAFTFCDYEGTPDCLLLWGSNKAHTHGDGVIGTRLLASLDRGTTLVVIDPRKTPLVSQCRYWLRVKPGTDTVLALAMLRVLIVEQLFDADFVEQYCEGFAELRAHLDAYTPERAAEITGVPAEDIAAVARLYGGARSAAIEVGTGIEQCSNSFQTARAINLLQALSGNLDRPGGDVIWEPIGIDGRRTFPAWHLLPRAQHARRLGGQEHRLLARSGWAHPEAVWQATLTGTPYPVKGLVVLGSNLVGNYANSKRVRSALEAIDFLAVADLYLTPTAALADVVLPVTCWLEREQIVEHAHYIGARPKIVDRPDLLSDEEILIGLARRLGHGDHFWPNLAAANDARLAPLGLTFAELARRSFLPNPLTYFKYRREGFHTETGKVQLYAPELLRLGYEPLPTWQPPPAPRHETERYRLISAHAKHAFNSEQRTLPSLRRRSPFPQVDLHPMDAQREGIAAGEWVFIEAGGNRTCFCVRLTPEVPPGVLCATANWWYPELTLEEAWTRSNLNLLTSEEGRNAEMGSSNFRGIPCALVRCEVPNGSF